MYFKASKQAVTEHTKKAFKRSQMQHSRFGAYFDKKFCVLTCQVLGQYWKFNSVYWSIWQYLQKVKIFLYLIRYIWELGMLLHVIDRWGSQKFITHEFGFSSQTMVQFLRLYPCHLPMATNSSLFSKVQTGRATN